MPGLARGSEGQRKADRGDGTFLNPILAGDHADPTVLKMGADYYMVHSSFEAPGLLLWHSRDLERRRGQLARVRAGGDRLRELFAHINDNFEARLSLADAAAITGLGK